MGVPCAHAVAVIAQRKLQLEEFVHPARRTDALRRLYAEGSTPILVDTLPEVPLLPPMNAKARGRPKKKRIPSATEKQKRPVVCSVCGKKGHNKRTCNAN